MSMKSKTRGEKCTYTLTVRISEELRGIIEQKAHISGTKVSSWVKDALEYSSERMGVAENKEAKEMLLALLNTDSEIRREIVTIVYTLLNLEKLKEVIRDGESPERIAASITDYSDKMPEIKY